VQAPQVPPASPPLLLPLLELLPLSSSLPLLLLLPEELLELPLLLLELPLLLLVLLPPSWAPLSPKSNPLVASP